MPVNSLKFWLLLVINCLMLGSLSFTALVSYFDAMHELDEVYDAQLARNARLVSALLDGIDLNKEHWPIIVTVPELPDSGEARTSAQERLAAGHKYERKLAFQVWRDGELIMASENAGQFPSLIRKEGFHEIKENQMHWISYNLAHAADTWIMTAQREDVRAEMSEHLAFAQIRPILLLMLPLSLLIYIVIKLILRPLSRFEHLIAQKLPEQLSEITLSLPAELQPIRLAINQLIQRVQRFIALEQRFAADAAHELRTPLSILQLHAQNLQSCSDPVERDDAVQAILAASQRMTHLVNQLLMLNRLERIQQMHTACIPVHQLLQDSLSDLPLTLLERVNWQMDVPLDLQLSGDAILLRSAFTNLLNNAAKYAVAQSTVHIQATTNPDGQLTVTVSNVAQSLPDVSRMGERFFRHAAHQQIEGSGLGLSVVRRITELHGGQLKCQAEGMQIGVTIVFLPPG